MQLAGKRENAMKKHLELRLLLILSALWIMVPPMAQAATDEERRQEITKTLENISADPVEALVDLGQAWRAAHAIEATGLEAWARAVLASRLLELGAPAGALEHIAMALDRAREKKVSPAIVDAASLMADAWLQLGEAEKAEKLLEEARREALAAQLTDRLEPIASLQALVDARRPKPDLERTLGWQSPNGPSSIAGLTPEQAELIQQQAALLEETARLLRQFELSQEAAAATERGDFAGALNIARERLVVAKEGADLATQHLAAGESTEAALRWREIEDLGESVGEPWLTLASQGLAGQEILTGDPKSARRDLTPLLNSPDPDVRADTLVYLAEIAQVQGHHQEAVEFYRAYRTAVGPPLAACSETGTLNAFVVARLALAETNLAFALSSAKEPTEAIARARCAVELASKVPDILGRTTAIESLARAYLLAGITIPSGEHRERDLRRAEALYEAVHPQFDRMRRKLSAATQIAALDFHAIPDEGLQQARIALGLSERALEAVEAARAPELWLGDKDALALAEIQDFARQQSLTFLVYSILHDPMSALLPGRFAGEQSDVEKSLGIWLVLPSGDIRFYAVELGSRKDTVDATLDATVSAGLESLRDGDPSWGNDLAKLLIEPILAILPVHQPASSPPRLVILPQGALNRVPFAALPVAALPLAVDQESGKAEILLDRFEIVETPSLSFFVTAARRASSTHTSCLIVGDPTTTLKQASLEADEVAAQLSSSALSGQDASLQEILRRLPRARLFHFAGHADGEGLKLAAGTELRLADVLELDLDLDLAVLSACKTAQTEEVHSQPLDLARAFLLRGSRLAIASLWKIEDAASRQFMKIFYRSLLQQGDPVRAQRVAALALRQQGVATRDWAGLIAVGAPQAKPATSP